MSDDTDSNVINLPTRDSDSDEMPDAPDGGELFYSEPPDSGSGGVVPPESPAETTMELPAIRGPISPEAALRETGMPDAPDSDDGEYEEDEYEQPRSLADRLGDWLEHRLEVARDRHAGEAPFREAEIARKAALLEARTAEETAMMEQNAKLHAAQMKSKADKAAARGKADAARSSSSGMGADKGGRSKAGGGGGSRGGGNSGGSGRGGTGGGRGSGTNGSGGTGRGSGGGNSPKGTGKGSDRSAGGRGGASKGNESSGGPKGRQNGSGGTGAGKSGTGKGSSGGSGKNGSGNSGSGKGGSKGDGGKSKDSPAASPRAERARGRQERAAARQAARQQRRSANQAANLADRSKDRDQDRAANQAAREERRRAKAERKAARRAKREAAKAADDRTTLGAAVAEEAQRRWDKRRGTEKGKSAKDDTKDATGDKDAKGSEATTKKMPKDGPESSSDGPKDGSATKEPDDGKKGGEKPSDSPGDRDAKDGAKPDDVKDPPGTGDSGDDRSFREKIKDFFAKPEEDATPPEAEESSRLRPEDLKVTVDRPGGPTRSPKSEEAEEVIPDAVIVEDAADPFGATVTNTASLPRAPEPHTQRPGTTRPTAQEDPVASEVSKPTSGQTGMAAKHRTDITFGEYLMEIVNIAIAAALDKDRAQELAVALGKVADALRDMAADLVGDHNIATEVVDQVTDLADAADRMKQLAERCATECEIASEAARIAAVSVGRVYGEDIAAMDDAGLAHASAAAHHD
ncbi:ATP/GTP-binding protein [Streptomyces sp. NPDC058534]|uniref:ATP/GTP-binding protein n=1 Tax=Streptomyces sp. NPDC058534 TaxID=3346541 RepID=UPI00364B4219